MRLSVAAAVACLTLSTFNLALSTEANAAIRKSTNIPAQNLGAALQTLARERNVQLVYFSESIDTLGSPGAVGELTTDEALTKILTGSGFSFRYLDDQTITIVPASAASSTSHSSQTTASTSSNESAPNSDEGSVRLGQVAPSGSREKSDRKADEHRTVSGGSGSQEDKSKELEEVVVTGTNIRGVGEVASPSFRIDRDEIQHSGAASIQDIFKSVTQNLTEIAPDAPFAAGVSRLAQSNVDNAEGISLRGLGANSTLVLLNGQRRPGSVQGRVFDTSAIPVSLIDHIEVVTGGSSAIYGSDAVAGVVNIVTRRDFDGFESEAYYSAPSDGGERLQLSQVFGVQRERAGLVAAYDYAKTWPLDATDAGIVEAPSSVGYTPVPGHLFIVPERNRHSAYLAGRFQPNDSVELFGDAIYTHERTFSDFKASQPGFLLDQTITFRSDQYSATGGAKIGLGGDRLLTINGVSGIVKTENSGLTNDAPNEYHSKAKLNSASAVLDGTAASLPGGSVRAALGIEARHESYESIDTLFSFPQPDRSRSVSSMFGELHVPLVADNTTGLLRALDASFAARYDNYSDAGSAFSPQAGLRWKPSNGLTIRGSYAKAFRAPDLFTLGQPDTVFVLNLPDAQTSGVSPVLTSLGGNTTLTAEHASTWTAGFDLRSERMPNSLISASYFDIRYRQRVDQPAVGPGDIIVALQHPEIFGGLTGRSPSVDQLASIIATDSDHAISNFTGVTFTQEPDDAAATATNLLAALPSIIIFDDRYQNIGVDRVSGVDASLRYDLDHGVDRWLFGLNGTYYIRFDRKLTRNSPGLTQLNRPGKPADFRLAANFGWERGIIGTYVKVNYVDDYRDPLVTPAGNVESWTKVDASFRLGDSSSGGSNVMKGLAVVVAVENVFDRRAPIIQSNTYGLAYDPTNADALGRVVSMRVEKHW